MKIGLFRYVLTLLKCILRSMLTARVGLILHSIHAMQISSGNTTTTNILLDGSLTYVP